MPDYQRGYAWEGEHLREFREDLDLIEPGRRHYTGTVVLRDRGRSLLDQGREVPLKNFGVVDGQQRITTCALLLDRSMTIWRPSTTPMCPASDAACSRRRCDMMFDRT